MQQYYIDESMKNKQNWKWSGTLILLFFFFFLRKRIKSLWVNQQTPMHILKLVNMLQA